MDALTERQREVLDEIRWCIIEQARPPSVRELMQLLHVDSPNGVVCHLKALERKGFIKRTEGARNIVLTAPDGLCPVCGQPWDECRRRRE